MSATEPTPSDPSFPPLQMNPSDYQLLLDHCRQGLPYEACGLIFGNGAQSVRVQPMTNAARSTTFYTLDPLEQMNVMESAEEDGLELIGIFHSHPVTRPYPSQTDIDFAGFWEDCWFLIASFRANEPELR